MRDAIRSMLTADDDRRDTIAALTRQWGFCGRPDQLAAIDAPRTVLSCGRGGGKNRTAAEAQVDLGEAWGPRLSGLVCGRTTADTREQCIYGESGMLAVAKRRGYEIGWHPGRGILSHPAGGTWRVASLELAEAAGRGANLNAVWIDELFHGPSGTDEALASILLAFRADAPPPGRRLIVTGTPNRYNPISRKLLNDPAFKLLNWSTRANTANLADGFVDEMVARFGNSAIADQELDGKLVAVGGGLTTMDVIEETRLEDYDPDDIVYSAVGVDPASTSHELSDETGIVLAGRRSDDHILIIADRSGRYKPDEWADVSIGLLDESDADILVFENNFGADMMEATLQRNAPFHLRHKIIGKRAEGGGKRQRAESIETLFAQRRMRIVGHLPALERQLTEPWSSSPDHIDALVAALGKILNDTTNRIWVPL